MRTDQSRVTFIFVCCCCLFLFFFFVFRLFVISTRVSNSSSFSFLFFFLHLFCFVPQRVESLKIFARFYFLLWPSSRLFDFFFRFFWEKKRKYLKNVWFLKKNKKTFCWIRLLLMLPTFCYIFLSFPPSIYRCMFFLMILVRDGSNKYKRIQCCVQDDLSSWLSSDVVGQLRIFNYILVWSTYALIDGNYFYVKDSGAVDTLR